MEKLLRAIFLFLSKNKALTKLAKKYGLRFGAARFVAGVDIESASEVIQDLNERGLVVTVDHLGEFIDNKEETMKAANESVHAIHVIAEKGLEAELSLKMTSLGLDISHDLVMKNMRKILDAGQEHQVTVTIDMEDYARCQKTIDIYEELIQEYDRLGTVIQAYLYRSEEDIRHLNQYEPYLRMVKGAYKESPEVAYPNKDDVDRQYRERIKENLLYDNYTAIATHDELVIADVKQMEKDYDLARDQFEFQMLYGIRNERQISLAEEGYNMRVYVPYGKDWYGYNMRRLAERPANVWFVLKGIFKK